MELIKYNENVFIATYELSELIKEGEVLSDFLNNSKVLQDIVLEVTDQIVEDYGISYTEFTVTLLADESIGVLSVSISEEENQEIIVEHLKKLATDKGIEVDYSDNLIKDRGDLILDDEDSEQMYEADSTNTAVASPPNSPYNEDAEFDIEASVEGIILEFFDMNDLIATLPILHVNEGDVTSVYKDDNNVIYFKINKTPSMITQLDSVYKSMLPEMLTSESKEHVFLLYEEMLYETSKFYFDEYKAMKALAVEHSFLSNVRQAYLFEHCETLIEENAFENLMNAYHPQ